MNLLLIHGRAQQANDPVVLQRQWEQALANGLKKAGLANLSNIQVVFPFYGDELDRLVKQIDSPPLTDVAARGDAPDLKELQFKGEMFAELAAGYNISDAEIQSNFSGGPQERGILNWPWVHAILKTLDRTPLGDTAIDEFTHDVYVYLTFPAVQKAIDRIVNDKLTPGDWVVVAHSLGTVVGYNVLRAVPSQAGIQVARYITVGSPLGVQAIRKRLQSPLSMPPCTKDWYNAFDKRDVVALYPLDAHNFSSQVRIENKGTVDNFTDNRHGIAGYLEDSDVARKIAEALLP
jgi:hypothetical protein